MMKLNDYRDEAYSIAIEHGWHDEYHSDEHFKCLIISELMEAVQADRLDKRSRLSDFKDVDMDTLMNYSSKWFDFFVKDSVEDELADACIRIFDLAGFRKIDLWVDNLYGKCVSPEKTFTENIYTICQKVMLYNNSLRICLNNTLKQIFRLAQIEGIDLYKHIELKMEYNRKREYKHGKLY